MNEQGKTEQMKSWGMWLLQMLIGWHFLYEGLWKISASGGWSSAGYLRMSNWIGAPFFHAIANNPSLLRTCDMMNEWGLTLIGLGLILGVLVRPAAFFGIVLLAFYYIANPPFLVSSPEGHYLYIDRNAVEAAALIAVMALPSHGLGQWLAAMLRKLGGWVMRKTTDTSTPPLSAGRREWLWRLVSLPVLGLFGYAFCRRHGLFIWEREKLSAKNTDATTSATVKQFSFTDIKDLKKPLTQYGSIGKVKLSRVILGGNLIGGWAHARDLLYMDKLVKAYHTDDRVFRTFHMAEACGVNTILTNPALMRVINDYWRKEGGKIQFISDCGWKTGIIDGAKVSVEHGACAVYSHGGISDSWAQAGKWDEFQKYLDESRKLGVPVGIGGHWLGTVQGCIEHGIKPDFWMKTFHSQNYWSARPELDKGATGPRDNNFCLHPEKVAEIMAKQTIPWIAFKTLAAGAIEPKDAFPYCFNNGADFICVGMYDFQIVEDINLLTALFDAGFKDRKRPWCAPNV